MVVSKLAKYESTIGAAVILHPGSITVDEINEVKVPTTILAAEHDHIFLPDKAKLLDDALSAKTGGKRVTGQVVISIVPLI
ncbi:hypothetical protein P3L10_032856 [Capsicum annuum]